MAHSQYTGNPVVEKQHFYIAAVTDSRTDKTISELPVGKIGQDSGHDSLVLLENSIKIFAGNNFLSDSSLIAVLIDIRQFEIKEKDIKGLPGREMIILFNYQLNDDRQKKDFAFFSFKQDLHKYMKTPAHYAVIFKKEVPEMLKQLNKFIANSLSSFPYRGIAVQAKIPGSLSSSDTVYYNSSNKLSWDDFKGNADSKSEALALTTSSIRYYSQSSLKDGYLDVDVNLLCFFLPLQSWVKPSIDLKSGLDHEQLHFDIIFLWTKKLLDTINSYRFSIGGWQYELEKLKTHFFEEMAAMQKKYDQESDYGRDGKKQMGWREMVQAILLKKPPL